MATVMITLMASSPSFSRDTFHKTQWFTPKLVVKKAMPDAAGARIRQVKGTPRLFVNGRLAVPNFLFVNTDSAVSEEYSQQITHQVALAKTEANQHLVSMIYWLDCNSELDDSRKYSDLDRKLDMTIAGDLEAKIMLRLGIINTGYIDSAIPASERMKYVGNPELGEMARLSMASPLWIQHTADELARIINYLRSSPKYAKHIIGLHLDCGEWFQYGFREWGLDISEANSRLFRLWLKEKYGTNNALQAAWGTGYSLETAQVPEDLPANKYNDHYDRTLLLEKGDARWIDYLDYISTMVTDRLLQISKVIKDYSQNQWVIMINYGYFFELGNAASGHYSLTRLLESRNVDMLTSPISYLDRGYLSPYQQTATIAGSTGAYMSTAESVLRAGKIWLFESDDMTYKQKLKGRYMTDADAESMFGILKNINEIHNVHKREAGVCIVNSTGMWPMELRGQGWLDDAQIWTNYNALTELYLKYIQATKSKATYEVAIVVDEKADRISRQPIQTITAMKSGLRYAACRMGASVCFVLLSDVLAGKVNDAKLYVFADPYRLSDDEVTKLGSIIHQKGKTSVFMYGFGAQSVGNIRKLTGMDISADKTNLSSQLSINKLQKALPGLTSDAGATVNPRYKVTAHQTETLGYYSDDAIGAALYQAPNYNTLFMDRPSSLPTHSERLPNMLGFRCLQRIMMSARPITT